VASAPGKDGPNFNLDYKISGSKNLQPLHVFDDGQFTYFEFDRKHTDGFKRLLAGLRDPERNPEWKYVDREYEIWMTKLE